MERQIKPEMGPHVKDGTPKPPTVTTTLIRILKVQLKRPVPFVELLVEEWETGLGATQWIRPTNRTPATLKMIIIVVSFKSISEYP